MNHSTLEHAAHIAQQAVLLRHQQELELTRLMSLAVELVAPEFSRVDLADVNTPTSSLYLNVMAFLPREVNINLSMLDLDSLKDQRLMDALEVFMDWGDPEVLTASWNEIPDRTYKFSKRFVAEDLLVTIRIRGVVIRNSPTCRKVCVGIDVTETPRYEIVCE